MFDKAHKGFSSQISSWPLLNHNNVHHVKEGKKSWVFYDCLSLKILQPLNPSDRKMCIQEIPMQGHVAWCEPFSLFLTSLASFSSKEALPFLVMSLHPVPTFLYSSQVVSPFLHVLYIVFFHLSSFSSFLLNHTGLIALSLDFRMLWSWVWILTSLLGPLYHLEPYPMGLLQAVPWRGSLSTTKDHKQKTNHSGAVYDYGISYHSP